MPLNKFFLPKLCSSSMFVPVPPSRRNRRTDRRSIGPKRFGRGIRAREGPTSKRSRREMAPQGLEKIESAPGNGMGSEASNLQDLVHGARLTGARFRLTSRTNGKVAEKGAKGFEFARCRTEIGAGRTADPSAAPVATGKRRTTGEGNFPACKALKTHETGKESRLAALVAVPLPRPPIPPSAARASSSPATASPARLLAARRVRSSPSRFRPRRR
jgi:hypothetical protein